jgi:hypothetical protein
VKDQEGRVGAKERGLRGTKAGSVKRAVFCRPDQCSRNIYVDDNSCLLVSSLPS